VSFDEALSYLLSLGHETLTIKLGLKNTETLLAALGEPHRRFPAVQIAGTNGKGSTAVFLDSICRAAGIRTGLFTSPHLVSITERIKIDGRQIAEDQFARFTDAVKTTAKALFARGELQTLPTYFEHVTAIALVAFREAKIDLAILETGLGGRLDSTTAAGAETVAITPVAMDHEEYLGATITQIAQEKAAIIRPGVSAVIAPQVPEVLEVILRRCDETNVNPIVLTDRSGDGYRVRVLDINDGRCSVTFETPRAGYDEVRLGLRGRHQIDNALVAVALADALRQRGFAFADAAIVDGLVSAFHAGRLELREGRPPILFDGAHNPASAVVLKNYLAEFEQRPITMIFGAMKDKRLNEMAAILFPKATNLVLTVIDNPRAADLHQLRSAVPPWCQIRRIELSSTPGDALRLARQITTADGIICVTGSLHLIGSIQENLTATTAA
jgi:dihydrofolate synthase/folylpolyglutamate synthase